MTKYKMMELDFGCSWNIDFLLTFVLRIVLFHNISSQSYRCIQYLGRICKSHDITNTKTSFCVPTHQLRLTAVDFRVVQFKAEWNQTHGCLNYYCTFFRFAENVLNFTWNSSGVCTVCLCFFIVYCHFVSLFNNVFCLWKIIHFEL